MWRLGRSDLPDRIGLLIRDNLKFRPSRALVSQKDALHKIGAKPAYSVSGRLKYDFTVI
jgi:hypothetical protein